MIWAEIFAASLFLYVLWWPNASMRLMLYTWYGLMVALSLGRYLLVSQYEKSQTKDEDSEWWERFMMLMLLMSALGWGFAGTVLLPTVNGLNQAIILFLLIGVAATANPFFSPIKRIYIVFLIPTLLPTAIYLLTISNANLNMFLGISMILFTILMLITCVVSSGLISTALTLHFQNSRLADDLRKSNKSLDFMAKHDSLTLLPNRQMFYSIVNTIIDEHRKAKKVTYLMFIDVDKFKSINDTLGHDVGDDLLINIAQRLRDSFDDKGMVFRLGGDEFVVILNIVNDQSEVEELAKNCCISVAEPIHIGDHTLLVSASIGISSIPKDGENAESLIKHADAAMYHSKRTGGNRYQFYDNSSSGLS
jgi:diguanylate cyclase (GGDEF)-like protein